MKDNIKCNQEENWAEIRIDSKIFTPSQVVATSNEFADDYWITLRSNSENQIIVKIISKEERELEDIKEDALDFQTLLISKSVEMMG